jgi:hypothetical protein
MMPSTTTGDLEKITGSILVRCFLILIRLKVVQDVITRHPVSGYFWFRLLLDGVSRAVVSSPCGWLWPLAELYNKSLASRPDDDLSNWPDRNDRRKVVLGPIEKDRKRCVLVDYVGGVVLSLSCVVSRYKRESLL